MRASSSVSAIVAFASVSLPLASAAGKLGFALGVKRPDGSCKVEADYELDLKAIQSKSGSTIIRIYDVSECGVAGAMLPAAKAQGFQAILGIWPETDSQYDAGKQAIVQYGTEYRDQIHAVTVGSESLYRGTYTAQQLVDRINDMRSAAPDLRYGTADSWNKYADGTANPVVAISDILLCNAFAYWQGATIDNAANVFNDDISQAFASVRSAAGKASPELWVGETGWPTEGTTYQNAVPTLQNAERFYTDAICPKIGDGTNVFVFEAFDEPWKPESIGEDGSAAVETHWGVMTAEREEKYPLKC